MPLPLPIPYCIALVGLLLISLVVLADGAARLELAWAVDASLINGTHMVAHIAVADE